MCPAARSARDAVAKIMGVEAGTAVKMRAVVQCQGSCDKVKTKYEYQGLRPAPPSPCTAVPRLFFRLHGIWRLCQSM